MATSKKTGTKRGTTKTTKRTGTAPKVGRPTKEHLKRSMAAKAAWKTRRTNAMHANHPG